MPQILPGGEDEQADQQRESGPEPVFLGARRQRLAADRLEIVDLHELVTAVIDGFDSDLETRGITLKVLSHLPVMRCEKMRMRQVFQNLGTNVIQVMNGSSRTSGAAGGMGSRMSLTWDDLTAIQNEVTTVKWVAPLMSSRTQVASDEQNWNTVVYGTTSVWFKIRNWTATQGSVFDEDTGNSNAAGLNRAADDGRSILNDGAGLEILSRYIGHDV